jgi:hypothetical protein
MLKLTFDKSKYIKTFCKNFTLKNTKKEAYTFNRALTLNQSIERLKFSNPNENSLNLRKMLRDLIKAKGPISISEYMNICLYDKNYGYYTTKEHIFGKTGDFITSPEVSQMFGEIIGMWIDKILISYNNPGKYDIIEIGCGRGFLMLDIIRTLNNLKKFKGANIIMIEKSEKLAKIQQDNLLNTLSKLSIFFEYKQDKENKSDLFTCRSHNITFQWFNSLSDYIKKRNTLKLDLEHLHTMKLSDMEEIKTLK